MNLKTIVEPIKIKSWRTKIRTAIRKRVGQGHVSYSKKICEEVAEAIYEIEDEYENKWSESGLPTENQQRIIDSLNEARNICYDYCGINEVIK